MHSFGCFLVGARFYTSPNNVVFFDIFSFRHVVHSFGCFLVGAPPGPSLSLVYITRPEGRQFHRGWRKDRSTFEQTLACYSFLDLLQWAELLSGWPVWRFFACKLRSTFVLESFVSLSINHPWCHWWAQLAIFSSYNISKNKLEDVLAREKL